MSCVYPVRVCDVMSCVCILWQGGASCPVFVYCYGVGCHVLCLHTVTGGVMSWVCCMTLKVGYIYTHTHYLICFRLTLPIMNCHGVFICISNIYDTYTFHIKSYKENEINCRHKTFCFRFIHRFLLSKICILTYKDQNKQSLLVCHYIVLLINDKTAHLIWRHNNMIVLGMINLRRKPVHVWSMRYPCHTFEASSAWVLYL